MRSGSTASLWSLHSLWYSTLTRYGTEKTPLSETALCKGLEWDNFQSCLPTSMILRFPSTNYCCIAVQHSWVIVVHLSIFHCCQNRSFWHEEVCETCVIKAGGRNTQTLRLGKQGTPLNTALSVMRESLGKNTLSATSSRMSCCNHLTAMSKEHRKVWYPTSAWFQHGNNSSLMPPLWGPFWDSH